jgi:hypothetical protein
LKETHLSRLFPVVCWRGAESAPPQRLESHSIVRARISQRCGDVVVSDASGLELCGDAAAAVAASVLRRDRSRVTPVRQVALPFQFIEERTDDVAGSFSGEESLFEFGARVFAPRQQANGLCAE